MEQKNNILDELKSLGSSLGDARQLPFDVPQGYFDSLLPSVMKRIRAQDISDPNEEIQTLSPLLAGMKGKTHFEVPEGYFVEPSIPQRKPAKLISMNHSRWVRYVAAVVVVGFLAVAALVTWRNKDVEKMGIARYNKVLNQEIGKMSELELVEFLENTNPVLVGDEKVSAGPNDEVKELLEDIPVSELKEFIEETTVFDSEEVLLN